MPRKRKPAAAQQRDEALVLKRIKFTITALLTNPIAVGAEGALPKADVTEAYAYLQSIAEDSAPTEPERSPSPITDEE